MNKFQEIFLSEHFADDVMELNKADIEIRNEIISIYNEKITKCIIEWLTAQISDWENSFTNHIDYFDECGYTVFAVINDNEKIIDYTLCQYGEEISRLVILPNLEFYISNKKRRGIIE